MANYRRFVTYFYDYSSGNKGGICGFGKIEYSMRSRVHITIQGKRTGREECVVYGMSGTDEPNQTLGRLILNYGKGSFLWEWNGKEKSADLFVRNMVGIVLFINDTIWAATRWDGTEFDLSQFIRQHQPFNPQEKSREERNVENRDHQNQLNQQEEPFRFESREQDKQIERREQCDTCTENDCPRDGGDECDKDSSKLNEVDGKNRNQDCSNQCKENCDKNCEKPDKCGESKSSGDKEICCKEENRLGEREQNDNCESGNEVKNTVFNCEKSEYSNQTNHSDTLAQDNDVIWNQLCNKYAKFMPFPQSSHIQCLKIHLGDLRRFSGENRKLANNNFLLRGYYRCHYIVLSRWDMEDGAKYYIGIPGIYQEREAKLASHFGFCVFAPFKGGDATNGKGGLWMTPLHLLQEKA